MIAVARWLGAGQVRRLLADNRIVPSRFRGQNFLADPNVVRRIVALAGVEAGDRVVEVGAGLGSLTVGLVAAGASVVAYEIDANLAAVAREVAPEADVRLADATTVDWAALTAGAEWKFVANLPYSAGTRILLEVLDTAPSVVSFAVMVQREVGERLVAAPGAAAYGVTSVKAAYHCRLTLGLRVSPAVFVPRPEVESVVVLGARHSVAPVAVDRARLFAVVDAGFGQRRKTLRRALRAVWPAPAVDVALDVAGVDGGRRAETLSLPEFAAIAEAL